MEGVRYKIVRVMRDGSKTFLKTGGGLHGYWWGTEAREALNFDATESLKVMHDAAATIGGIAEYHVVPYHDNDTPVKGAPVSILKVAM